MFMMMRKCDCDIVVYHKIRPIKMESSSVIPIDNSYHEDLGSECKLFTETHEVISIDDDDNGDGAACRYEAQSVEMGSKSVITIDDDDLRSKDDIDIIIVDEDDEELGSRARTAIMTKAEEDLNISDVKIEVVTSEGVLGMKSCNVPEELIIKDTSCREPSLRETDGKEHGMTHIKECVEGIKIEPKDSLELPNNRNSFPEEVSNQLCPFQYPDLSNNVKAGKYFQAKGSSEVIEDGLDSRLVIDEIKEEDESDMNFESIYDSRSGSGSGKSQKPDLEHTSGTEEKEACESYECSSTKEEINKYRCFTCKRSFPHHGVLVKHILKHTGGKVYPCDECCMQFILMSQLIAHKDKKHLKTIYNCKHCSVTFTSRSKLMNHISIHTGERPYYCAGCGDIFTSNSDLVEHRLKSGERPFYCEECGARFPWKSMLRVHQKAHGEIKQCNVCPVCSQAFRYSVLLLMHQVTAGHGIPYWYDEGFNALNPKKKQGGLKLLCFHMLKVAPKRVRGRLRIVNNRNASQMT